MPTYDYACLACDHRFDAVQPMSDEPLAVCPECGGQLRRVFGTVGVTFKGPGFYRTDSRRRSESGKTQKDSGATQKESGATQKEPTTAKPEAKTPS